MATRGQMNRKQKTRDESGSLLDKMLEGSGIGEIRKANEQKRKDYRRKKAMEAVPGIETSRTRAAENKRKAAKTPAKPSKMDSFMKEVEAEGKKIDDVKRVKAATKAHKSLNEAKGEPRTIAQAKKMGKDYFVDSSGTKKAAVTKEELAKSGMSLGEYLNKKGGKTPAKKAKGGMAKKAYAKGGYANCGASMKPTQKSSKGMK
jgi:hypothetical protein